MGRLGDKWGLDLISETNRAGLEVSEYEARKLVFRFQTRTDTNLAVQSQKQPKKLEILDIHRKRTVLSV